MNNISFRRAAVWLSLGLCLQGASQQLLAMPVSLDTTWLDANGRLTLTTDARQTLALTGIGMSVGGKATTLGEGVFNLPISRITADIKLLPPSLTMQAAQAMGSSLDFANSLTQAKASLADLSMDFNTHTVYGDVLSAGGKSHLSLFTFDVTAPLSFSLKGGISVNMTLGNLHFTDEGATSFVRALGVPDFLAPVLKQVDFGAIDARVVPWLRKAAADDVAVMSGVSVVASVPEPGSAALLYLGLAMMGMVLVRRRDGGRRGRGAASHEAAPGGHP